MSAGPFAVAGFGWHSSGGAPMMTVVCRATFDLAPGICALAAVQEPPRERESFFHGKPSASLYEPGDFVPLKDGADVLLVGSAFAPERRPVASLFARLRIGTIDKVIRVVGDRRVELGGREGAMTPFTRMPLRYERARGGAKSSNPIGIEVGTELGARLPNLLHARGDDDASGVPACFGPIPMDWPARAVRLGSGTKSWSALGWRDLALPEGLSPAYFNSAPDDQRLVQLHEDEPFELESLHRDYPLLVTRLPGVRPHVTLENDSIVEVDMACDTLWIDTDRSLCTLTWRGSLPMDGLDTNSVVVVGLRRAGPTSGLYRVTPTATRASEPAAASLDQDDDQPSTLVLSLDETAAGARLASELVGPDTGVPRAEQRHTQPDLGPSPSSLAPASIPEWLATPSVRPRAAWEAGPSQGFRPSVLAESWRPGPIGSVSFAGAAPPASVLAASNAAVTEPARVEPDSVSSVASFPPAIELIWMSDASIARVERRWPRVPAPSSEEPQIEPDGRLVVHDALLSHCATPHRDVSSIAAVATSRSGEREPPIILIDADLRMEAEPAEALNRLAGLVEEYAGSDPEVGLALKDVRAAQRCHAAPQRTRERLRAAYEKAGVGPLFVELEKLLEEGLLESRSFRRQLACGAPHVRCTAVDADGVPIPLYLPEEMAPLLPTIPLWPARIIAEIRPRQHQADEGRWVLIAIAVARRLDL